MKYSKLIGAVCVTLLLAGCEEVNTSYFITANPRRNSEVTVLVGSTAERLRLKLDQEGLSPTWHSYARGALSYDLRTKPGEPTSVFLAEDRLVHKREFNRAKQDLTNGLRRIDAKMRMYTSRNANPLM